jgi:hypothetical protein
MARGSCLPQLLKSPSLLSSDVWDDIGISNSLNGNQCPLYVHDAAIELTTITCFIHRISRIPGEEYISSCLCPFRRRYSMAAKSFLSRPMPFSNSVLSWGALASLLTATWRVLRPTYLANDSKCGLAVYFRQPELADTIRSSLPHPLSCIPADTSDKAIAPLFADPNISLWALCTRGRLN